jgi:hypothetical protein
MIQTLEYRRLLSVTIPSSLLSSIEQTASDATAIRTALQHDVPVVNADLSAINAAFHGLSNAAQDHGLLSTLRKAEMTAMVVLKGDILKIMHVGGPTLGKALRAVSKAQAHPSTATHAAASAAIANLQSAIDPLFTKFGTDVASIGATISGDVSAIQSANSGVPAVQNAVAKLQSDYTGEFAALQTHFQALQTDFQNLRNGLTALA